MSWMRSCTWASTGCQWAMLPNDFPPPSTVQRYFYDWRSNAGEHQPSPGGGPGAGRTRGRPERRGDPQSVKTTESGGVRGYDAPHEYTRPAGRPDVPQPISRTATARPRSSNPSSLPPAASPLSPTPPTRDRNSRAPLRTSAAGSSRSSSALSSCQHDGSSRGPSPGSTDAVDWPRIGRNQSPPHRHGFLSPTSDSSQGGSQGTVIKHRVSSRTLRAKTMVLREKR